jgi:hypothetical protein
MYGINENDIKTLDEKLLRQKHFLSFGTLDIDGSDRKLIECTYSANINPKKYFAEVNNRVNTIMNITTALGLSPVFITITAPSRYHKKDTHGNLLIDPNITAKALTQIFNDFTNTSIFKKIRKEYERGFHYIRTYEPHKSGVPHLHAMLFLPQKYIKALELQFQSYFTDKDRWGNNSKSLKYIYEFKGSFKGAISYIMKYILKTFKNEDNKEVQYSSYWFLKHRIRRFLSSRSLIPLGIYRKIRHYFKARGIQKDLEHATKLYHGNAIYYDYDGSTIDHDEPLLNKDRINIRYLDPSEGEIRDTIIYEKKAKRSLGAIGSKKSDRITLDYKQIQKLKERQSFKPSDNKKIIKPVSQLSDYELFYYFQSVDKFPTCNSDLHKYLIAHNEMIQRDLMSGKVAKLTAKALGGIR